MTDTVALRAAIATAGVKYKTIAEILGISTYTLQLKIDNSSEFKASEIDALSEILGMDMKQRDSIFFCHKSGIWLHFYLLKGGGEEMKVEIIGEPKEIAALVLAVQERQAQSNLDRRRVIEDSGEADHAMTARCSSEHNVGALQPSGLESEDS